MTEGTEKHLGVIIEEIEQILEGEDALIKSMIEITNEEVLDESGEPTGQFKEKKHIRSDNLDTIRTLALQYLYYEIKNLEDKNKVLENYILKNS
jgi:hypothetical protein